MQKQEVFGYKIA